MNERYKEELNRIALTPEGKRALVRALARPRPGAARRALRTLLAAAAVVGLLAAGVGASVSGMPVARDFFGGGAGYEQSAAALGRSVTADGWTFTLTDCVGDVRWLYLGLELTAPEGTVLDEDYVFDDWRVTFPGMWDYASTFFYEQLPDDDPTDNRMQFMFRIRGGGAEGSFNGSRMSLRLRGLQHRVGWDEAASRKIMETDCAATWDFGVVTLSYPDSTIRLSPNAGVTTLEVEAVITQVEVSPLGVYVRIEGDALVGHHEWVEKNAPDGFYGCIEYQEVTLVTRDGEAIPMMGNRSGSGCSGGDWAHPEPGYLRLLRASDALLDLDSLDHISVCGVEIPLHQD